MQYLTEQQNINKQKYIQKMKRIIYITGLVLCITTAVSAQDADNDYLKHVKTMDSTIETLYSVISGEKGEARDWDLFRYLFRPEAKLIPSGKNRQGVMGIRYMTADDYVTNSGKWLEENGFFEKELSRKVQTFGNVTHVFSSYESFRSEADEKPFARGINSIQLYDDGNRWWIVNIYWTGETPENPIPKKYLPKSE